MILSRVLFNIFLQTRKLSSFYSFVTLKMNKFTIILSSAVLPMRLNLNRHANSR